MDLGLRGRTAVVTGADSGMGLEIVRMLLNEGARVLATDKDTDTLTQAAQQVTPLGEVHAVVADLTDVASVERLRDEAERRLGAVDILVNAAGSLARPGPFHMIDDAAWMSALEIDLMGAVRVVRAFVPA